MIRTADNQNKSINFFKVNTKNEEEYKSIAKEATLIINTKFKNPTKLIEIPNDLIYLVNEANKFDRYLNNKTLLDNFINKVIFWSTEMFTDILKDKGTIIVDNNNVSKYEIFYLYILYNLGNNILFLCQDMNKFRSIGIKEDGIEINEYIASISVNYIEKDNSIKDYYSIEKIEDALYKNGEIVKSNIIGISSIEEIHNFYAKLNITFRDKPDAIVVERGFRKIATQSDARIVANDRNKTLEIIVTAHINSLKDIIKREKFRSLLKDSLLRYNDSKLNDTVMYNRMESASAIICDIIDNDIKTIVYYGNPKATDCIVLGVLGRLPNISVIVINPDKHNLAKIDNIPILELDNSIEIFELPSVDKREISSTMAAKASNLLDNTLFNGDIPGIYRPDQMKVLKTIPFNITYEEIPRWYTTECYMRVGFTSSGDEATLPIMFNVIKGCNDRNDLSSIINNLKSDKAIIVDDILSLYKKCVTDNKSFKVVGCKNLPYNITKLGSIQSEHYARQNEEELIKNNNLNFSNITSSYSYRYKHLSEYKQREIINKINDIIKYNIVSYNNRTELLDCISESRIVSLYQQLSYSDTLIFRDLVLNTLLNLSDELLELIQWHEYSKLNPKLLILMKDKNGLSIRDAILITFMRLMGFDINIFIPTRYSANLHYIGKDIVYNEHIIGEAIFDFNLSNQIQKKKGLFKLFR